MHTFNTPKVVCIICGRTKSKADIVSTPLVRHAIADLIKAQYPAWSTDSYICTEDLAHFRSQYIQNMLASEKGDLTALEQAVIESIKANETIPADVDTMFEQALSFGERLADRAASMDAPGGTPANAA